MTSLPPARWSVMEKKKSEGIYTNHPCQHSNNPLVALALLCSWSSERNKKDLLHILSDSTVMQMETNR